MRMEIFGEKKQVETSDNFQNSNEKKKRNQKNHCDKKKRKLIKNIKSETGNE